MVPDWFNVPSTFQARTGVASDLIGNFILVTASLEMKHPVAPLSNSACVPTILPSYCQIGRGMRIELLFDPDINTGAIVWERDDVGSSSPFKKTRAWFLQ